MPNTHTYYIRFTLFTDNYTLAKFIIRTSTDDLSHVQGIKNTINELEVKFKGGIILDWWTKVS